MSLCSLLFGMDTGQCGTVPMYLARSLEVRTADNAWICDLLDMLCVWSSLCTVFFHVPADDTEGRLSEETHTYVL